MNIDTNANIRDTHRRSHKARRPERRKSVHQFIPTAQKLNQIETEEKAIANRKEDPFIGFRSVTDSLHEAAEAPNDQMLLSEDWVRGESNLHTDQPTVPEKLGKSHRKTLWLSYLFGWLGAHRFYLGLWRGGLVQLSLSLLAVSAVAAVATFSVVPFWHYIPVMIAVIVPMVLWGILDGMAMSMRSLR